jgi:hypothetical protein
LLFVFDGFYTGDDVEVIQEALRSAIGLPYQPWFLRNLFLSEVLVAPALRVASLAGVESRTVLTHLAAIPFLLAGTLNVWLTHRVTRLWRLPLKVANCAALIYAFSPLGLAFSSMVSPRVFGTTFILLGVVVFSSRWSLPGALTAGLSLSVAFAIRYSEGLFLLPLALLAFLPWATSAGPGESRAPTWPSWRPVLLVSAIVLGFVLGTLVTVGLTDQLTWGEPFSSLEEFARYTLVERQASAETALQPASWYLRRLGRWATLPLVVLILLGRPKSRSLLFVVLPLLVLSYIHHKDIRYVQGLAPFLGILGAEAVALGWRRSRVVTALLLGLTLATGAFTARSILSRKSMAAVSAAQRLAKLPGGPSSVALSQSWAYGDLVFFPPGTEVLPLSAQPTKEELASVLGKAQFVGLYAQSLETDPSLGELLETGGFALFLEIASGRSKAVQLFCAPAYCDVARSEPPSDPPSALGMHPLAASDGSR